MKAYILRGISGSGKSTWADEQPSSEICSANTSFTDDNGEYKFDAGRLGKAHAYCLRKWIRACRLYEHRIDGSVICDNTNLSIAEIAPYYATAQAYGHDVSIVQFNCTVEEAWNRATHGVPRERLQKAHWYFLNIEFPPWWKVVSPDTLKEFE